MDKYYKSKSFLKGRLRQLVNGFWYRKIKPCKECGSKGYMHYSEPKSAYECSCLYCTRTGKSKHMRLGALIDWNRMN